MSRAQQWVQYFLSHRHVTMELIHKIDEAHYDYKPTPTSMTAKQLATHRRVDYPIKSKGYRKKSTFPVECE
ncbi:hypothetical protein JCM14450A_23810 [Geobacillus stearothermophilus]